MKSALGMLAVASAAYGAVVNVAPGAGTLSAAIASANDGDIITLSNGLYSETAIIEFNKTISIIGAGTGSVVSVNGNSVPVVFKSTSLQTTFSKFSISNTVTSTSCSLGLPIALQGNFSLAILNPALTGGVVSFTGDLGNWFDTRTLNDFSFGVCKLSTDPDKLKGGSFQLASNCHGQVPISIDFSKLMNCNVEKFTTDRFQSYRGLMDASMTEYVEHSEPGKLLRMPRTRKGNSQAKMLLQLDRVGRVMASLRTDYLNAELQAVITKVDVQQISDNQSVIELNVTLPAPYKIVGNTSAIVTISNGDDWRAEAGNWSIVGGVECDGLDVGQLCNQTVRFNVTACDLTATYVITEVPIDCMNTDAMGLSYDGRCPIAYQKANITFDIDTNNFCDEEVYNLNALFELEIVLRPDDGSYVGTRPDNVFVLGARSYWTIYIWTNSTGVGIRDAQIINATRTSTGDCSPYPGYLNDTNQLLQTFTNAEYPARINFPMLVTNAMTCTDANVLFVNVTHNFTVRVDYIDSTFRRRRRDIEYNNYVEESYKNGYSREARDTRESKVSAGVGVKYTKEDLLEKPQAQNTMEGSGPTTATILLAISAALFSLVCCCSCCVLCGVVVKRRRQQKEKEAQFGMTSFATSAPSVGFSTMKLNAPSADQFSAGQSRLIDHLSRQQQNMNSPSSFGPVTMATSLTTAQPAKGLRVASMSGFTATNDQMRGSFRK